jgi:hypothetical protein
MGVGMWQRMTWLGIVGFVVMVVAASACLAQWRSHRFVAALGSAERPPADDDLYGLRVIQGGRSQRPRTRGGVHPTSTSSDSRFRRSYAAWLGRLEARWQHRRDQNM